MQSKIRLSLLLLLLFVSINYSITAQEKQADTLSKPLIRYGDKGFELSSANNNYFMHIEWRGQFRISYPTDTDPITLNDFEGNKIHMYINRARIKVGGHSYQSWLKYYLEYELAGSYLLDFRLMIEKFPFLKIKIGQWKVQYNRERIISSGKQQTAERSILTRQFTIDRQQGLSLFGHLKAEGIADFNYWISALMGTGRGNESNDDHHLMYMMRLQWNFMGEPLKFEGSDLDYHKKFAAIIAVGLVTNQSQYTRFSSSGGGQLEGFTESNPGQYRINQSVIETAGMYKGFSWQQELHWKQINDLINTQITTLTGNLVQFGYFPHYVWSKLPKPLEIYTRYAFYIPNLELNNELRQELTMGLNWFFSGHRNKLTIESSYLENTHDTEFQHSGFRYRIQWDISF